MYLHYIYILCVFTYNHVEKGDVNLTKQSDSLAVNSVITNKYVMSSTFSPSIETAPPNVCKCKIIMGIAISNEVDACSKQIYPC